MLRAFRERVARHSTTLFDQVVVSGGQFFTIVLLARTLDVTNFGVFTTVYACVIYVGMIQQATVLGPLAIIAPPQEDSVRRVLYRGAVGVQLILMLPMIGSAFIIANIWMREGVLLSAISIIVGTMGLLLVQWVRRVSYIERPVEALKFDMASIGAQLLCLLALVAFSRVTTAKALLVMGLTSLLALIVVPRAFLPLPGTMGPILRKGGQLGGDLLISAHMSWVISQGVFVLGSVRMDLADVGTARLALVAVAPLNLVIQAASNVLPVRVSMRLHRLGAAKCRKEQLQLSALIVALGVLGLPFVWNGAPMIANVLVGANVPRGLIALAFLALVVLFARQQIAFYLEANGRSRMTAVAGVAGGGVAVGTLVYCSAGAETVVFAMLLGQSAYGLVCLVAACLPPRKE